MNRYGTSAPYKIMQTVGVLLVVAIGVRIAAGFLMPMVPVLVVLVGLTVIYSLIFRGRGR